MGRGINNKWFIIPVVIITFIAFAVILGKVFGGVFTSLGKSEFYFTLTLIMVLVISIIREIKDSKKISTLKPWLTEVETNTDSLQRSVKTISNEVNKITDIYHGSHFKLDKLLNEILDEIKRSENQDCLDQINKGFINHSERILCDFCCDIATALRKALKKHFLSSAGIAG